MKFLLTLLFLFSVSYSDAQNRPEWHAHRGFRALMPESTVAAMKNAVDLKADVLEFDITFTSDKQAVLSHDPWLDYLITLDENGKEIAKGKRLAIYQMKYKDLRKYDVGSKQHKNFPQQKNFKARIPLLKELLDSVEAYVKLKNYPKPLYNIETKTSRPETESISPHPKSSLNV